MDIKRVAFETRPVKSTRPAVSSSTTAAPARPATSVPQRATTRATTTQPVAAGPGKINREEIAAIVDRFLADVNRSQRRQQHKHRRGSQWRLKPAACTAPVASDSIAERASAENGGSGAQGRAASAAQSSANGHKTVDFVSEDDVRRAIQKGEKIYITAKTIITPAARDIGEPAEDFCENLKRQLSVVRCQLQRKLLTTDY